MNEEGEHRPKDTLLAIIARDLATETFELEEIFQRYQIDQDYFDRYIKSSPYFQKLLQSYIAEWQAPTLAATNNRLKFQAAAALEEKLPVLANRMGDRGSQLADAVAVAKLFKELAGIAPPASGQGAAQGEKFSIRIDFGHHSVALETRTVGEANAEIPTDVQRETSETLLLPKSTQKN